MTKHQTTTENLIDYIMGMTEEQMEKFLNHPVVKAVMAGEKDIKTAYMEVVGE